MRDDNNSVLKQASIFLLAIAVLIFSWVWPLALYANQLFTIHMVQHLLTMNVAALLFASVLRRCEWLSFSLPLVATFQMASLWLWHTPAVFIASHGNFLFELLMKASLFAGALLFWIAILDNRANSLWSRILTLLITGKVFCLLGAVFVFTRRPLYPIHGDLGLSMSSIEDQQLAGLVMVSACALTYVAAAIALFVHWMFKDEKIGFQLYPWRFSRRPTCLREFSCSYPAASAFSFF